MGDAPILRPPPALDLAAFAEAHSREGVKRGFPPVIDANTRLLVLGSLPGEASLASGQYYGHPRNAFWRLMEQVLDVELVALGYDARLAALLAHGVGVWDVIAQAKRRGSLDAAIRDPSANDLLALVESLPNLRVIGFNGATAAKLGGRLLADRVPTIALPSSSPAHAARSFEEKAKIWRRLAGFMRSNEND